MRARARADGDRRWAPPFSPLSGADSGPGGAGPSPEGARGPPAPRGERPVDQAGSCPRLPRPTGQVATLPGLSFCLLGISNLAPRLKLTHSPPSPRAPSGLWLRTWKPLASFFLFLFFSKYLDNLEWFSKSHWKGTFFFPPMPFTYSHWSLPFQALGKGHERGSTRQL